MHQNFYKLQNHDKIYQVKFYMLVEEKKKLWQ